MAESDPPVHGLRATTHPTPACEQDDSKYESEPADGMPHSTSHRHEEVKQESSAPEQEQEENTSGCSTIGQSNVLPSSHLHRQEKEKYEWPVCNSQPYRHKGRKQKSPVNRLMAPLVYSHLYGQQEDDDEKESPPNEPNHNKLESPLYQHEDSMPDTNLYEKERPDPDSCRIMQEDSSIVTSPAYGNENNKLDTLEHDLEDRRSLIEKEPNKKASFSMRKVEKNDGYIRESSSSSSTSSHGLNPYKKAAANPLSVGESDVSKYDNVFICSLCDLTFDSSDLIQVHMQSHTVDDDGLLAAINDEGVSVKDENDPEADNESAKRKYQCTYCFKVFCSKYNLDVHTRIHTGEKPYECSVCGKTFGSSSNCRKHLKTHKAKGVNEIKEDIDFMNFIKVHPDGERPFECTTCSKRYTCKSDAQKHLRVHTGRKPFNCAYCAKTFSCSSNLYTHMRRKHKDIPINPNHDSNVDKQPKRTGGEKMFRCKECNIDFDTRFQAENHMTIHKTYSEYDKEDDTYSCTMCDKIFPSFESLFGHMMDHKKDNVLTCSYCGKAFNKFMDLTYHMRLHNGEYRLPSPTENTASMGSSHAAGMLDRYPENPNSTDDSWPESSLNVDKTFKNSQSLYSAKQGNSHSPSEDNISKTESDDEEKGNELIGMPTASATEMPTETDDRCVAGGRVVESSSYGNIEKVKEECDSNDSGTDDYDEEQHRNISSKESMAEDLAKYQHEGRDTTTDNVKTSYSKDTITLRSHGQENDAKEETSGQKDNHECVLCGETFICRTNLQEHSKIHIMNGFGSGSSSSNNLQGIVTNGFQEHEGESFYFDDGDSAYECFMCGITFDSRKFYIEHMKVHTKEKSFICYICGKNFSRMKNLRQHFVGHTGERAFSCPECGKSFIRKVNLKNHMRAHTGDQPHKCSLCHKGYNSKYDLDLHMRSHTGEKPCHCPDCGKAFASNGHLHKHMKTHTVGESQHRCSVCFKTFFDNTTLRRHFMIHTGESPFECAVCGKTFRREIRLRYHMRVHTGEQPYKCSVCSKSFNSKYQVETHMRSHTGEKPFQCTMCERSFQCKSSLTKHLKGHLEENQDGLPSA